jgi:hypothetical protein
MAESERRLNAGNGQNLTLKIVTCRFAAHADALASKARGQTGKASRRFACDARRAKRWEERNISRDFVVWCDGGRIVEVVGRILNSCGFERRHGRLLNEPGAFEVEVPLITPIGSGSARFCLCVRATSKEIGVVLRQPERGQTPLSLMDSDEQLLWELDLAQESPSQYTLLTGKEPPSPDEISLLREQIALKKKNG